MSRCLEFCAALFASVTLLGVEPTPFEPWFAVDFAHGYADGSGVGDWSDPAGGWSLSAGTGCSFVSAGQPLCSYIAFNAVTNGWLNFTSASPATTNTLVVHSFRAAMRAYSSREALPDLSDEGARGALLVAARPDHRLAYFGWTRSGWVELSGTVPSEEDLQDVRIEIDESASPATVSYAANGGVLVSASNPAQALFVAGRSRSEPQATVSVRGTGKFGAFSARREVEGRTLAVQKEDGSVDYYAEVAAALEAARSNGGRAILLRRTELVAANTPESPLLLSSYVLGKPSPPLVFGPAYPAGRELFLELPAGTYESALLATPVSAMGNLHIHGVDGQVHALVPDPSSDAVRLSSGRVRVDEGNFTGWVSIPAGGRLFAAGVADVQLGTNHTLFVQGLGLLTLCGTNEISGGLHQESGALRYCSTNAIPRGPVTRQGYHSDHLVLLLQ